MSNEHRIFGPPGTGKTTALAGLVATAARDYGSDAILVASFTRTAAAELVGRKLPLDPARVGTLHAHCYRALGRPKLATGAKVLADFNKQYPHFHIGGSGYASIDDPFADSVYGGNGPGDEFAQEYDRARARMLPLEQIPDENVRNFAVAWEDFKRQTGYMDFTDLIEHCIQNTEGPPLNPSIFFADEVQDFSKLELTLIRHWSKNIEKLYLAGDDDQCIYAFKGSTPDAFLHPAIGSEYKTILSQSYRVPRAVHRIARDWILQVSEREPKDYKPRDFEGAVSGMQHSLSFPKDIVIAVKERVAAGKTVAILASCNFMLTKIRTELMERGVPFHNPLRYANAGWNPLYRRRPEDIITKDRVLAYIKPHAQYMGDQAEQWTYRDLHLFVTPLEADGILKRGAKSEIRASGESPERGKLPVEGADFEKWFSSDGAADGDLDYLLSMSLKTYADKLKYPVQVVKEYGGKGLTDAPKVLLGTIHSVKGGEADSVFLAPDISPKAAAGFFGKITEERDAVIRMFYVGITRAKEELIWLKPMTDRAIDSPL